ncbi:MAG TPA: exodeoxyribonuclease VII large subunit [Chitinispirillaceae bacterium]|nr:exodeoxyribonuclease VII large subunit [Chitinispirillaceae bacterium]
MNENSIFLTPQQSPRPYSVSEINQGIALAIESSNNLVWVEGEISNWKPSTSGHCYFRLKDADSQIPAVVWRTALPQIKCKPEDGMAVMAIASVRVYQKGGYYQLDIHKMQEIGSGALNAAFEKLKQRLQKEGLFDQEHKKQLPESIRRIGVITSKRGAAFKDILRVASSRSSQVEIVLIDVLVQGEKAAQDIAQALQQMNHYNAVDCIIVGRGGGSIEDLWAFNEEVVARAIYDSQIPVISAVGHEIDFTIADFVADVRAPTPSAAAEIAVRDQKDRLKFFNTQFERFSHLSRNYFQTIITNHERFVTSSAFKKPLKYLLENIQYRDELESALTMRTAQLFKSYKTHIKGAGLRLNALSPLNILSRGYSVVTSTDGTVLKDTTMIHQDDLINVRFFKGSASAKVTVIEQQTEPADSILNEKTL